MWYVWYFDSVFDNRYVRCPGMPSFKSNSAAKCASAKARSVVDISYIVLPY